MRLIFPVSTKRAGAKMPTTNLRQRIRVSRPPESLYTRAYVARGLDLDWTVRRFSDGEIIAKSPEKSAAVYEAERLGFSIY